MEDPPSQRHIRWSRHRHHAHPPGHGLRHDRLPPSALRLLLLHRAFSGLHGHGHLPPRADGRQRAHQPHGGREHQLRGRRHRGAARGRGARHHRPGLGRLPRHDAPPPRPRLHLHPGPRHERLLHRHGHPDHDHQPQVRRGRLPQHGQRRLHGGGPGLEAAASAAGCRRLLRVRLRRPPGHPLPRAPLLSWLHHPRAARGPCRCGAGVVHLRPSRDDGSRGGWRGSSGPPRPVAARHVAVGGAAAGGGDHCGCQLCAVSSGSALAGRHARLQGVPEPGAGCSQPGFCRGLPGRVPASFGVFQPFRSSWHTQ
mmetsp:Transcript_60539/g.161501  ORF Transcript_60539/g.161501 Transcript_60539/m.161501 type:complete len:311 (-) Transcript_60539:1462-2394(-)